MSPFPAAAPPLTPTVTASGGTEVSTLLAQLAAATARLDAQKQVLEEEAAPQIRHSEDRLRDVSATMEAAATSLLDGFGSLSQLVTELGALALPAEARPLLARLAEGVLDLTLHMQFQDITSQQLRYVESVLRATEAQLLCAAAEGTGQSVAGRTENAPVAFDPRASAKPSPHRQASIDALFVVK